jgi:hypothetical protein
MLSPCDGTAAARATADSESVVLSLPVRGKPQVRGQAATGMPYTACSVKNSDIHKGMTAEGAEGADVVAAVDRKVCTLSGHRIPVAPCRELHSRIV